MTFAAPAALWGLLAIPVLVALYLLRIRRREHPVSSILLWQRSAPTLAAFRPSRRIERSLLLLLQVVTAAALVAALAQPEVLGRGIAGEDIVLVLDASLSMAARDVAPTRFGRARAEALEIVGRLRPGQRAGMVLGASRPLLLSPLTADRARLRSVLEAAEPWETAGDVAGAVALAASLDSGGAGRIIAWTDAARGPLPAFPRTAYRLIGTSDDNVGITTFRVLRDPAGSEVLVRVENFGRTPHMVPLEIRHLPSQGGLSSPARGAPLRGTGRPQGGAGVPIYNQTLELGPGASRTVVVPLVGLAGAAGGAASGGVLQARLAVQDVLPEDDVASVVLDPSPLPSVLLVSPGNPYLERLLRVLPVSRAAQIRTADPTAWRGFGVVILDRVTSGPLPPGNYVLIGTVPPNLPIGASGTLSRAEIATWDRTHPVLRFVSLDDVHVGRALELTPQGGQVLVAGETPLIWAYEGRGIRALVLGFSLEESDLPRHVAFPILMANSLAWLGGSVSDARVGDDIQVPASGADAAVLATPDGRRLRIRATDGMFPLPPLTRAGVYRLTTPTGDRVMVVGLGSPRAGLITPGVTPAPVTPAAPSGPPPLVGGALPAGGATPTPNANAFLTRLPLWPWLLLVTITAAIGEWVLATRLPAGALFHNATGAATRRRARRSGGGGTA